MSAIFGIWYLNGEPVEEKHLRKMQDKVSDYGRNEQDIRIHQNIGFGCCLNKWSIHSHADVPVYYNELKEIMLVGDAQIYNRDELIGEYGLTEDKQISTQALLFAAYKKWGEDCPKYLNGDFTFAIWEKQKRQLMLVRDHLGVRPLYYFYNKTTFAFATDYRALLALPFVGKELDDVKMYTFLSGIYHINTEITFFKQIKKLPAAHVLSVDKHEINKKKYWEPGADKKISFNTEAEYAQALHEIVNDAIKIRIHHTAAEFGSELSGGLDSSVVTILANRELMKSKNNLKVYSWSPPFELFEKQPRDEREFVESVCQQEGLECRYDNPDKSSGQEVFKRPVLTHGGSSEILQRGLQAMSSEGVRFVLTGWGGDEGISHRANLWELFIGGYWGCFLKEIHGSAQGSFWRFIKLIIANTVMPLFGPFSYFGNPNKEMPNIVNKEFAEKIKESCKKDILYFKVNPVKHIQSGAIQTRTELTAWLGADYNVQYLFPFLDFRVVDFAMSIPGHWFYKQGISRYIYRKAFENILPEKLCYYPYKEDTAAQTFRNNTEEDRKRAERAETAARLIEQEFFSSYIDWNKLRDLMNSPFFQENSRNSRLTLRKIETCGYLQLIRAEAEQDQ